jgi:tetratricopeptide (TPR) repeat protein
MRAIACLACLLSSAALAEPPAATIDLDTEAARRHFQSGLASYNEGNYQAACAEFETARRIKALPALDFNIARCYERLERWGDAADAYERFLAARTPDADPSLRGRIAVLRDRALAKTVTAAVPTTATSTSTSTSTTTPTARVPLVKRAWFWATVIGGVAVVATGVGVGVAYATASHPAPVGTFGTVVGN